MQEVAELKQSVVLYGRQMAERGLVAGTWGNISLRSNVGNRIAITPSGQPYSELTPEDIVVVDTVGNVLEGRRPSSELPLHLAIYTARADVRAIVHTHSLFATACAVAGEAIPPSLEEMVQVVGGTVDVARYALPGTADLASYAVEALGDKTAVLLSNHGAVACGPSLKEALLIAELVEKAAHIHVIARQLGGARCLSDDDVQLMRRFYVETYRQP
jgi:L-ribulose-5-phosphate 4-epimerase